MDSKEGGISEEPKPSDSFFPSKFVLNTSLALLD